MKICWGSPFPRSVIIQKIGQFLTVEQGEGGPQLTKPNIVYFTCWGKDTFLQVEILEEIDVNSD